MPDLARSAGVPAQLANEDYVEALARIVYYWGYPAVDGFGRTSMWEIMKDGPGTMLGTPARRADEHDAAASPTTCRRRSASSSRRTTTRSTASGFADLGAEPAVIQTPTDAPPGHYWTIQIVDVFTNVDPSARLGLGHAGRQVPAGRPRLEGREAGRLHRHAAHADQLSAASSGAASRRARRRRRPRRVAVLNQIGMYPLSKNQPGRAISTARPSRATSRLSARRDRRR